MQFSTALAWERRWTGMLSTVCSLSFAASPMEPSDTCERGATTFGGFAGPRSALAAARESRSVFVVVTRSLSFPCQKKSGQKKNTNGTKKPHSGQNEKKDKRDKKKGTKTKMKPKTEQKGFLLCVRFSVQEGEGPNSEKKGAPKGGHPRVGHRPIRAFFPFPPQFSFFLPSLGGLLVEFWWCLKRRGPLMCTFGVLGLSCGTPNPCP